MKTDDSHTSEGENMFARLDLKTVAVAVCLFVSAGFSQHANADDCDAPVPDLHPTAPNASVPPSAAAFNGVWAGTWYFNYRSKRVSLCTKIYVLATDAQHALMFYCSGSQADFNYVPQCRKMAADINGNELSTSVNGSKGVSFRLNRSGSLDGEYPAFSSTSAPTEAEFTKVQ